MVIAFCLLMMAFQTESTSFTAGMEKKAGFFDLYWDNSKGALYLAIRDFDQEFLFVNSLATGLGSNDVGIDRGQLGRDRLVQFRRIGNKVFLVQRNLDYRAESDNPLERRAVAQSFAYSTLWGTEIKAEEDGAVLVDLSDFIFRDEQNVASRISRMNEGSYRVDMSRSHYVPEFTKSFPDNSEIQVALTFSGEPRGEYVRSVTPTAESFTLHQRYSLVRLPEDDYQPRTFHPASGGFSSNFRDYAVPLDAELDQRRVVRHHLVRKNPNAKRSELVEPLVYYVDSGAPPQIRDALLDGARWWNDAFEAAGIINGFEVKVLPGDADPMDVRYNVIQWVHRSTRGWSYGGSVIDPRNGRIIKGHVTLGSLRVRQDRLIFEGMIPHDGKGVWPSEAGRNPVELALARIRQLSAHEVGHTLGLSHNFAASSADRCSVMDYPAPLVTLKDGKLDFSTVYGVGIGEFDKLSVRYLYGHFKNEKEGLAAIIQEAKDRGIPYIADQHGRSPATMHPIASVWENGADAIIELERMIEVRAHILANFSHLNMSPEKPLSRLQDVFVPAYLHHRFQVAACAKSIGGVHFDYSLNDGKSKLKPVSVDRQRKAVEVMLQTITPDFLDLPEHLRLFFPPRADGYEAHREEFQHRTGAAFDDLAMAETAARLTLDILFDPTRLNRLYNQKVLDPDQLGVDEYLDAILGDTILADPQEDRAAAIHRMINYHILEKLISAMGNGNIREDIRARVFTLLTDIQEHCEEAEIEDDHYQAQNNWIAMRIENIEEQPSLYQGAKPLKIPPGSPIGSHR